MKLERAWFRTTHSDANKWHMGRHVSMANETTKIYTAMCGYRTYPIHEVDTSRTEPDDEYGNCLRCRRADEMENRVDELMREDDDDAGQEVQID